MKHYVIVKWNEKVQDKNEYYKKACEAFAGVTKIPGVTGLDVCQNCNDRSGRFDIMVEIECTEEGLENYDVSKLHQDWKANYTKYIKSKTIFDRE